MEVPSDSFEKIRSVLGGLDDAEPDLEDVIFDRLKNPQFRSKKMADGYFYIDQAEEYFEHAVEGDYESFIVAERAVDEFQQVLQMLQPVYQEDIGEITSDLRNIKDFQRKVQEFVEDEKNHIVDREYEKMDRDNFRHDMNTDDGSGFLFDGPYYTPVGVSSPLEENKKYGIE